MLARLVGLSLLAVAGFVPATASAAPPTGTICVGLILDAQSLGGSVTDTCVNVEPGTTGVGVLEAAGHSVTYRRDGLICTIDNVPDSGCSEINGTYYWAYYHRAPDRTTWSYSVQDARTYKPANRSTEGWVFDTGSKPKPENIPASRICAGLAKPTTTPTPTAKQTHHATKPRGSAKPSAATSASPSASPSAKPASRHRSRSGTPIPPDASASPDVDATRGTDATPTPVAIANDAGKSGGNGSATGALVAAAVIAVLAGATVIGARRRRT